MAYASLFDLPPDIIEAQTWAHHFAEKYVRPVAAEYDEREETPWTVLEEAPGQACTPRTSYDSS